MRNRPHLLASSSEALHGFRTCRPLPALAITLEPIPPALRSTRNHLRTAVRQGASWTAAYHLQLTVAAVAKPIRGSVVPSECLRLSGPGGCSPRRRLPGGASSRYREVGRRRRGRHCQQASHGVGRRCPACGVHPSGYWRPGSGCPAVRCPVTWGRRPESPAVGRLLSTRPASSRLLSTRPASSRLLSTRPVSSRLLSTRPSGRVRLLPPQAVAVGPGRGGRATVTTGTGGGPCGCRAVDGSIDGRGGRDAGDAAQVALVTGRSVADPGRRVGCGPRRPRLPAERPGRPGRRAERPSRAAARWAREQAAARGGCTGRVAGVLGLGCATTVRGRRRA
jgi:hypothetical protein